MPQRNHDRAAGMSQTSIAVSSSLLKSLSKIALAEKRSRNNVIEVILQEGVNRYAHGADLVSRKKAGGNGR